MADAPAADDSFGLAAKRRRRRFWVVLLLVVLVPAVAFTAFRVTVSRKLAARLESLRQAGYPTTLQDLNDWYKEPTGENAAGVLLEGFGRITATKEEVEQLLSSPAWRKLLLLPDSGSPSLSGSTKDHIRTLLEANAVALKILHEGVAIKEARYPVNFLQGFGATVTWLGKSRRASTLVALEAAFHAENNRMDSAIVSVRTILGIARSMRDEPLLISQLVRIALQSQSVTTLEWVVNRGVPGDKSLAEMSEAIHEAETQDAFARGLAGELVMGQEWFTGPIGPLVQASLPQATSGQSSGFSSGLITVKLALSRLAGGMDLDRLESLEIMEGYLRASQLPMHEKVAAANAVVQTIPAARPVVRLITPELSRALLLHVRSIATLRVVQAALAVERYRLAHGKLPEKLDDVAPRFIKDVPLDPFTGKPLYYKKLDRGFTVYSVGDDLTDHGGVRRNADGKELEPGSDIPFTIVR